MREAIRDQLARFAEEVKDELAKDPVSAGWSEDDLLMLAHLYVDQMLSTASLFLEALEARRRSAGAPAGRTAGDPPDAADQPRPPALAGLTPRRRTG